MRGFGGKSPPLFIAIALFIILSIEQRVSSARYGKQYRRESSSAPISIPHKDDDVKYLDKRMPRLMREVYQAEDDSNATIFNVLDYGAKGDGTADDTQAFEAAWMDACKLEASTMMVPSGSVFLVNPITFSGSNCQPNIVFQVDGKIIAPTNAQAWGSGLLQWLEFKNLKGITIRGKGIIDGQGSVWWTNDSPISSPTEENEVISNSIILVSNNNNSKDLKINADAKAKLPHTKPTAKGKLHHMKPTPKGKSPHAKPTPKGKLPHTKPKPKGKLPHTKPTALRFYGSSDVTVTGITIQDSQQTHLKFDDCTMVQVFDFSALSPGDSPNTDGIHLQNSANVLIHNTNLACGDDCISIQTGCSGIFIHDVMCGPGHGISIGSLGKDNTKACVSNVTVRDITMHDTLTGVRIKTWQGGSGSVQGVVFANIQVLDVKTPIIIDQYYCDGNTCSNHTSAVGISAISFQNITGTYTKNPVHFACSDTKPCTGVTLSGIELTAKQETEPFCWQTYGKLYTDTIPPINCLMSGDKSDYNLC